MKRIVAGQPIVTTETLYGVRSDPDRRRVSGSAAAAFDRAVAADRQPSA
jgi:hypothetical protein